MGHWPHIFWFFPVQFSILLPNSFVTSQPNVLEVTFTLAKSQNTSMPVFILISGHRFVDRSDRILIQRWNSFIYEQQNSKLLFIINSTYLNILTPFNLPSWNERTGGSPLNTVVSGFPQITSSFSDGQPINAKSPSSSKMRLLARLIWSRLVNGIGGLYLSPVENTTEKY